MGTIINFPKAKNSKKKKIENLLVEKLPDHDTHCDIGDVKFTCATCNTSCRFRFDQVIFKTCDFYCSSCGTGYKISNPLFVNKQKAKNQ